MHITQESDYAVRIVYCLAKCGTRGATPRHQRRNVRDAALFPEDVGKLVSSGIVESYKGATAAAVSWHAPPARSHSRTSLTRWKGRIGFPAVGRGRRGGCNRGASGCCTFKRYFHDISKSINEQLAAVNSRCCWRNRPASKKRKSHTAPCVPSVVFSFLFFRVPLDGLQKPYYNA